ncbi:MAG: TrkH family potassium uptake protein [Bacteroidales bacterium]|nr:TrkH family potassium uptake protein [Bacteroidales bacterium]
MRTLNITLRFVGFALMGIFVMVGLSALVAFLDYRDSSMVPLLTSAGIILVFAILCLGLTKRTHDISIRDGYFIVTGCWLASCLFGAIPFALYGNEFGLINAWFESVSGFTTTGASILNEIESLPKGILFWRMATSWIGGIGVVSLISIVISSSNDRHSRMAAVELSSIAKEFYKGRRKQFVYRILVVYVSLTLITTVALRWAGLTWFDAACHAMSACSTCGFSTKNLSIAAFNSPVVEGILIVAMFLAGVNFSLLFSTFWPTGVNRRNIFNTAIVRVFFFAVLAGTLGLSVNLWMTKSAGSFGEAIRVSAFQMCSIATTTGFATTNTDIWPNFCKGILFVGSLICGCSGSTSGGIKIDRIWFALKGFREMMQSLINPNKYDYVRVDGHSKKGNEISAVMGFIMLYILIVAFGMVVYTMCGMDFETGLSAAIASMGNVGPGFGEIGSMGNYAGLSNFLKMFSTVLMLLGRLEIYPIFIVVGSLGRK